MIRGHVVGLQAQVEVIFQLPHQPNLRIRFVVDTGFAGALTLSVAAVAALGLRFHGQVATSLADDSSAKVDVYEADIVWDGRAMTVAVLAMGRRPLLGTALLDGFNLNADFIDNGGVTIQALPPSP
jgi:clan AA aspartic protease